MPKRSDLPYPDCLFKIDDVTISKRYQLLRATIINFFGYSVPTLSGCEALRPSFCDLVSKPVVWVKKLIRTSEKGFCNGLILLKRHILSGKTIPTVS